MVSATNYFNNIFNWPLPYTYSATYVMLAATASLFFLVRHVEDGRARDLDFSVACLVLAALGKIETTLPPLAAHLVFVATERPRLRAYLVRKLQGQMWKTAISWCSACSLPVMKLIRASAPCESTSRR